MKRVSFIKVCRYLWQNYGDSCIARLTTNEGYIVPKTYVHFSSNTIFTRDERLAKLRGYTLINL